MVKETKKPDRHKIAAQLSRNIIYLRGTKNWSQYDLSEASGVLRTTINNWENVNSATPSIPRHDLLRNVAVLFDLTPDDLLYTDIQTSRPRLTASEQIIMTELIIQLRREIRMLEENNASLRSALNYITMSQPVKKKKSQK